jgi:NAD(P)-dependent dehydrogenase (short-subunit alcohol dehydrogenase family)
MRQLRGTRALVTGAAAGIGRAIAIALAGEGCDLYLLDIDESRLRETAAAAREMGVEAVAARCDVASAADVTAANQAMLARWETLDILVNNAGEQHVRERLEDIEDEQIERTFRTNIFSQFYLTRAALKHLGPGSSVINTASVTAYSGHPLLLDYSSTKGAIVAFTRSLSLQLAPRGIRVNAVAPGPIWTPLIPAQDSFTPEMVERFGKSTPLGRAGQPDEVAPCYVFLASSDASYISGQVLHPNGGQVVNG